MNRFEPLFTKTLSRNDVGETNSHQAGLLLPKSIIKLNYFPSLNVGNHNPRQVISFFIVNSKEYVTTNFIFYNSKHLGLGTRTEYRLTGIRGALKVNAAAVGSTLEFGYWGGKRERAIHFIPKNELRISEDDKDSDEVIRLSNGWRVIGRLK